MAAHGRGVAAHRMAFAAAAMFIPASNISWAASTRSGKKVKMQQ